MVEFALIAPLLLLILFGIIELGMLFALSIGLANSAREGARAAALFQYQGTAPTSGETRALQEIDTARLDYTASVITDTLSPLVDTEHLTLTLTYTPDGVLHGNYYRAGDTVEVALVQQRRLFFGLFGRREFTLRARSAGQIEPGGSQ